MMIRDYTVWTVVVLAALLLACSQVAAQVGDSATAPSRTVVGARNPDLAEGAQALRVGHAQRGVDLTLAGLEYALGSREVKMAHSNLCAGYLMLKEFEKALDHCNTVIELDPLFWRAYNNRALVFLEMERYEESEADIAKGQKIRPKSEKLKIVKGMLLDETRPVRERIEIDERRNAYDDLDDPQANARE